MGTTVHLTFDALESIDLALGLPVAPRSFQSSTDSRVIQTQPEGEITHLNSVEKSFTGSQPGVKFFNKTLLDHRYELLSQLINAVYARILLKVFDDSGFFIGQPGWIANP